MSCHSGRKFPEFIKKKAAPVRYLTDEELTGTLSSSRGQSRAKLMKDLRQQLDLLENPQGPFFPNAIFKAFGSQFKFRATGQSLGNRRHASIVATCTHHQGTLGLDTTSLLGLAASTVAVYTQPVSVRALKLKLFAMEKVEREAWINLWRNHAVKVVCEAMEDVIAAEKEAFGAKSYFHLLEVKGHASPISDWEGATTADNPSDDGSQSIELEIPVHGHETTKTLLQLEEDTVALHKISADEATTHLKAMRTKCMFLTPSGSIIHHGCTDTSRDASDPTQVPTTPQKVTARVPVEST
ncbi:hypothetical protein LTR20_006521 [Exophiala xenobiotica]|nr:hypothetical protein LTR79_007651 [Exophiala xenobiotica]KAK5412963.1 hypothetical protein LTR90_007085 [Exophiala xenobiotica]KAK5461597.1 hypothetical protein LTR20_006521 [Exophiala xenobiotica]KAK5482281.1 hypothetical protein LTR26_006615 [Exophiala xenobiotica]KAK5491544.1 hypothetical protein LTR83_006385 [Exophiala xenobiotica]